ncbi:MAG TPA: sulfite exporter TauE/SafE family protein [Patescibacteria group bacterium]|nr:sulfite exporter TauE/SafE family protein [Patescibacteria group bacterium]
MIDGILLLGGGGLAGLFGSLLGLGGGILIVPILTLGFGLPLIQAVGVSLVAVIVTSGAASGVYLERRVANLRLGMTLELFTAMGALVGGLVAFLVPERILELVFAGLLTWVAVTMLRRKDPKATVPKLEPAVDGNVTPRSRPTVDRAMGVGRTAAFLDRLSGPDYRVGRLGLGAIGSVGAGVISALLGIGGGLVKVPVMHVIMGVPLRVATATSNLMIGITASASAIIYLLRGGIDPYVAAPTAIGVFVGASIGSRVAHRIDLRVLRGLFVAILLYTAWQMLQRAIA